MIVYSIKWIPYLCPFITENHGRLYVFSNFFQIFFKMLSKYIRLFDEKDTLLNDKNNTETFQDQRKSYFCFQSPGILVVIFLTICL